MIVFSLNLWELLAEQLKNLLNKKVHFLLIKINDYLMVNFVKVTI